MAEDVLHVWGCYGYFFELFKMEVDNIKYVYLSASQ